MKIHKTLLRPVIAVLLGIYGLSILVYIINYLLNPVRFYIAVPDNLLLLSGSLTCLVLIASSFGVFLNLRWGFYLAVLALGWDIIASLVLVVLESGLAPALFIDLLIDWILLVAVLYFMEK